MARSLNKPWLKDLITEILTPCNDNDLLDKKKDAINNILNSKRTVQIIGVCSTSHVIFISDRTNSISLFLTPSCYDDITEERSLESMKFGQATVSNFHLTTVVQTAGNVDLRSFAPGRCSVSFPLAIQCNELQYLGGDDCAIMGNPRDINKDDRIRALIQTSHSSYETMTKVIGAIQFPNTGILPSYGEYYSIVNI